MIVLVGFLAKAWFLQRLRGSIKHEYDDRLEKLKAGLKDQSDKSLTQLKSDIDRQTDKLRAAVSSYTDVQKATISRKLEAVDVLWVGYIKLMEAFPAVLYLTDTFTDEEMKGLYTSPSMGKYSAEITTWEETSFIGIGFSEVQAVRPHLGEYAWAIYETYRTIMGRSIYLIKEGRTDPARVEWYKDQNIQNLVRSALGEDGAVEFAHQGYGRFKWLNNHFSAMLLAAIDKILTGQTFSESALAQAQKMDQQITATNSKAPA